MQKVLRIGKTRFFELVKEYRNSPTGFSMEYVRKNAINKIAPEVEENIMLRVWSKKVFTGHLSPEKFENIFIKNKSCELVVI